MSLVDEYTLSQYIDGSLDYQRASEVAEQIARDRPTADMMGELLKVHVLLKSIGNETIGGNIPDKLTQTLREKRNRRQSFFRAGSWYFKLAASVVMILSSIAFGYFFKPTTYETASIFPQIPEALGKTVSSVLEDQKSGSVYLWVDETNKRSARISPVETFRNTSGGFYRIYNIDLNQAGINQHFTGVAFRKGKNEWQTQSVFVRENAEKI